MSGKLGYHSPDDPEIPGSWGVEHGISSRVDLEEWLEKFDGRYVTITITAHERDETGLIKHAEQS